MAFVRSFRSKMENCNTSPQCNFSFKIKKLDQKLQRNTSELTNEDNTQKDFIKSLENKKIKSTVPKAKEKKKELVIPHIKNNNWRLPNTEKSVSTLEDMAIKEILDESAKANEDWEKRENRDNIIIPLLIQNKIPDGYETENKMDVALRPNNSTLADYESVPIKEYGYALLRGMGWKPGVPIGDKNKKDVKPNEVVVRPKGLGLGAGCNSSNKKPHAEEENLVLKRDCYIYIEKGQHTGEYGQVEGLDEDNGRVIIKLAKAEEKITLPELFVRVVTEREFNKESRIINKRKYEEHKSKLLEEKYEIRKEYRSRDSVKNTDKQERSRDKYSEEKIKKRKHSPEERSYNDDREISEIRSENWVMPMLRVRFVDKNFKNGKYFNTKMVIEDLLTPVSCICKTESGNVLEDIHCSMLETVIPRSENSYVMIVQGRHKGQVGIILKRDKPNCIATVQLLSDRQTVLKLNYDYICEYLGDVSHFD